MAIPATDAHNNGAFISNKEIYNMQLETKMQLVALQSSIKILGLVVSPIFSTACAIIIPSLLKG